MFLRVTEFYLCITLGNEPKYQESLTILYIALLLEEYYTSLV